MEKKKEITGSDAIEKMRLLKRLAGATFSMRFITCDLSRDEAGEVRLYEKCRVRPARKDEGLKVNPDHYLFFSDESKNGEARQCFKKLIRAVAFPPNYEWFTVKWFI